MSSHYFVRREGSKEEEFHGRLVKFSFDGEQYKAVTERLAAEGADAEIKDTIYELILQKHRSIGGSDEDSGTVCRGTIASCQAIGRGIVPYWNDMDNSLRIGDPTEAVREAVIGRQRVFEAFPLCGWEENSVSSPTGGQCYTVVVPLDGKVVSLSFLLGKNRDCKGYERCWRKELTKARKIVASID